MDPSILARVEAGVSDLSRADLPRSGSIRGRAGGVRPAVRSARNLRKRCGEACSTAARACFPKRAGVPHLTRCCTCILKKSGVLVMTNNALPELTAIAVIDNAECWHSDGSHKSEPYGAIARSRLCKIRPLAAATRNSAICAGFTTRCRSDDRKLLAGLTATHHWSKSLNPRFAGALDEAARRGRRAHRGHDPAS